MVVFATFKDHLLGKWIAYPTCLCDIWGFKLCYRWCSFYGNCVPAAPGLITISIPGHEQCWELNMQYENSLKTRLKIPIVHLSQIVHVLVLLMQLCWVHVHMLFCSLDIPMQLKSSCFWCLLLFIVIWTVKLEVTALQASIFVAKACVCLWWRLCHKVMQIKSGEYL